MAIDDGTLEDQDVDEDDEDDEMVENNEAGAEFQTAQQARNQLVEQYFN